MADPTPATSPAAPPDASRLTTHVLDTATGSPAVGLTLHLVRVEGATRTHLKTIATNADGRCDAPLLLGEAMEPGTYEIAFAVGTYFARSVSGSAGGLPSFLNTVPCAFGWRQRARTPPVHLHVPLLISPYGYSTYRGS